LNKKRPLSTHYFTSPTFGGVHKDVVVCATVLWRLFQLRERNRWGGVVDAPKRPKSMGVRVGLRFA